MKPTEYGFTKSDVGALDDGALIDKSFAGPGADYVFWNGLHGTSKLHALIASWTLDSLPQPSTFEQTNETRIFVDRVPTRIKIKPLQ